MQKKTNVFSRANRAVRAKDPAAKNADKVLGAGKRLENKIRKAASRSDAVALALMLGGGVFVGLGVHGTADAMKGDHEFSIPTTTAVENGVAFQNLKVTTATNTLGDKLAIAMEFLLGMMMFAGATRADILTGGREDADTAIDEVMKKIGMLRAKNTAMIFGLVANYMTDAEYATVQKTLARWRRTSRSYDDIERYDDMVDFANEISPIVNAVIDRNVGLRAALGRIAGATNGGAVADFQAEANKIRARNAKSDAIR